ncbi:MAG: hypothetical protein U0174_03575 [Polyangiaceae bacterium]
MTFEALLQVQLVALADLLAPRLARLMQTSAREYTSKAPPPGMSTKRFNERCREASRRGDRRVQKLGRVWVANEELFVPRQPAVPLASLAKTNSEPWSPEGALGAAGLRARRK